MERYLTAAGQSGGDGVPLPNAELWAARQLALQHDRRNLAALLILQAYAALHSGNPAGGRLAAVAARMDPGWAPARLVRAWAHVQSGDPQQVDNDIQGLAGADASPAWRNRLRGSAYLNLARVERQSAAGATCPSLQRQIAGVTQALGLLQAAGKSGQTLRTSASMELKRLRAAWKTGACH